MTDPIKAKIQELCPDVMELKFGCRIRSGKGIHTILHQGETNGEKWSTYLGDDNLIHGDDIIHDEILGSPITLPIVLRAMIANHYYPKMETSGFTVAFFDAGNENVLGIWNLLKNWDDQTEETKRFIGSLLGV